MMNKRLTVEQIAEIVESHEKWLKSEDGGKRANFEGANCRGANFVGANLIGANFVGANFEDANFEGANLIGANCRGANLIGANLVSANLVSANFEGAKELNNAQIWDTNLGGTTLDGRWVVVAQIGARKGTTCYNKKNDIIRCGCFKGTLDEFAEAVEREHSDHPQYLAEYRAAITYIKEICKIEDVINDE